MLEGQKKYFGKVNNFRVVVYAFDAQEARLKVARKYKRERAPHRTIADILYDVSVRRAVEGW